MKTEKGCLLVLSGPSGVGKSTVIAKAMEELSNVTFSVSATTREPRPGEQDGVQYYFVSRERFASMIAGGEFLEHAEYVGNCYGTPRAPIEDAMARGIHVILDIEVQGEAQVKRSMPESVSVFILPPSFAELERRLRGRNQDSEEKIAGRLQKARQECAMAPDYDFIIVNDDVETAAMQLRSVLIAGACMTRNMREKAEIILAEK